MGGKGRGVLSDFKMSRVCQKKFFGEEQCGIFPGCENIKEVPVLTYLLQYNFRVNALAGNLPGVKKAQW
jgi:ribosomal protein S14